MHLQDEIVIGVALDRRELAPADAEHVARCSECQARLAWWRETAQELEIARASTPSADAVARYEALFAQINRGSSRVLQSFRGLVATLIWDGRSRLAGAGIRNANAASYRLLYAADPCEVELMVEPSGRLRVIEGAWMEAEEMDHPTAALVELFPVDAPIDGVATEVSDDGRFRLDGVTPGTYRMMLTPVRGPQVLIEPLEIG